MTKTQLEVITSVQRRRRWSRAEKERIVAAALGPGVVASEVAREAGIHTSQLFRWRQQLCKRTQAPVAFNPVAVAPAAETAVLSPPARSRPARSRSSLRPEAGCGLPGRSMPRRCRRCSRRWRRPSGADDSSSYRRTGVVGDGAHRHEEGLCEPVLQVQELLRRDPLCGHLFCFRGRRGNLLKVIWHDGQGACLFTKRLERGRFLWPSPADGVVTISSAQLGYLLSCIDWRHPQETWRPTSVG